MVLHESRQSFQCLYISSCFLRHGGRSRVNKTLWAVCSIVVLCAVSACNGAVAPFGNATAPGSQAETVRQYTKGASKHGFLVVDPAEVASCGDNAAAVATVRWRVDKPAADGLRIEVGNEEGAARKLFSLGGDKGEAVTERWVGEGTAFYLVDVATGKDIDAFVVGSKACGA